MAGCRPLDACVEGCGTEDTGPAHIAGCLVGAWPVGRVSAIADVGGVNGGGTHVPAFHLQRISWLASNLISGRFVSKSRINRIPSFQYPAVGRKLVCKRAK